MVNAQEWLDKEYPASRRSEKTELDISKGKIKKWLIHDSTLKGDLKLEGFTNLRTLNCSGHELTNLDVSGCQFLTDLDCQGNKLNNLKVNGCSSLRTVNCSNNYIRELDLITCPELEEVNINNCPELNESKINSNNNLTRDALSGKLMKSGSQIFPAKDSDIRNILIVGITGNGKSALANTLSNTSDVNKFGEGSSSTSKTKSFEVSDIIEWEGKNYRIIDNIGFGDTSNIAEEDILFEIGKGIHSAKEGINQILFVFKGRFAPEHIKVFNVFKKFISESKVTDFTTLVRTNFPNFREEEDRQEDQRVLRNQSPESVEIVNSCNGIVYVDNPAIPSEDRRKRVALKKREDTKKIVFEHLADNCQNIYKLKEWGSIYAMVENYIKRKEEIEQSSVPNKAEELKKIKAETAQEISKKIEVSVGAGLPMIGNFTATIRHETQKVFSNNS